MSADAYFRMGSTHSICQDYCIAYEDYAFLADGCSGVPTPDDPGSPHTDYGARFLVRAAQGMHSVFMGGSFPAESVIRDVQGMAKAAWLPKTAIYATLLGIVRTTHYAKVYRAGDGVIVRKQRDGSLHYNSIEYNKNMPYYLAYRLEPGLEAKYKDEVSYATVTQGSKVPGGRWTTFSREEDLAFSELGEERSYLIEDTELVLIFSDGIKSFQTKDGQDVSLEDVLDQFLTFKSYAGEFITRRCNFFQKTCLEKGWKHADDFSVAGIYLGSTL